MKLTKPIRWTIGVALAVLLALALWWLTLDSATFHYLLRLYKDPALLQAQLHAWGWLAPVIFIFIQALQVVISPIPGEATGFLGGYLFGLTLGFIYSTVGLTIGTMAAFWVGRWLGGAFVRRYIADHIWERLGFIVEAEGAILAFIIYLIPGFPKDIAAYLFGISPMPTWIFAMVSTLGRMPGTWVLSAQGGRSATGNYLQVALISALAAAVAIPLYYYRHQILSLIRRGSRGELS